jgi:hypothetical protein
VAIRVRPFPKLPPLEENGCGMGSAQSRTTLYTTSVSKAEILYGIAVVPEGRGRLALAVAAAMFADDFEGPRAAFR